MKRALVLGSSGAGKSTLARQLGNLLDIEVIHLDSHYWLPGWVSMGEVEWDDELRRLLEKDQWIMDGNYLSSLDLRLSYADTAIFIDLGRVNCLARCVGRYLEYRGTSRQELAPGCYEKIDWEFLKWIWNYPRDIKPGVLNTLEQHPNVKVIYLRSSLEIEGYLSTQATLPH